MPVSESPSPTDPFLVIYVSRLKAIRSITLSLAFLFASVGIGFMPVEGNDHVGHIAHIIGTYGGPPFFTLTLIWSVRQLFSKKPLLVFDGRGITTRSYGLIPWSEIAEVRLSRATNRRCFSIIARDIESLASLYPAAQGNNLRFNQENMGMVVGVGEASLPMKVEQLLAEVGGYCERNIRIYRTLSPHLRTVVERALNTPPPAYQEPARSNALDPGRYTIDAEALQAKKTEIEKYVESSMNLHDCFETEDGTGYEGYILEVSGETILFEWAYSPFTDGWEEPPFEIPIAAINLTSLVRERP